MARQPRPLSQTDKEEAFRTATKALPKWYGEEIGRGMTDSELSAALERVLGIWGGSCGPDRLDVRFQGSGLKIWAGWHIVNHVTEAPLFKGKQTVAMARYLYGIDDPDKAQMSLF
ncbi:hypothetical protein [Primorskyibacter sp. 2E233]|uniref:hypothetical protein n=1 Tax=Primorskyibacter sp. 2E233 TaxID=3413431 RepID=UPI003BF35860